MSGQLEPVAAVAESIERGEILLIAGDAHLLERLPAGRWIGGSIPYLVAQAGEQVGEQGGEQGSEQGSELVHVTRLHDVTDISVQVYDSSSIRDVYADLAGKGFGVIIIPASSRTHLEFALHAPGYRGFAVRPLVGWISGVHLDGPEGQRPSVYCGTTRQEVVDGAVVMQVTLPPGRAAEVGVVNIFEQGDGEVITFPSDGFDVTTAFVDGVETNFADFVRVKGLDTRLPLVADFYGLMVNVSFRAVDSVGRAVRFYSPVFAGLTYRHARAVGNYTHELVSHLPQTWPDEMVFSCNCILNYFYSESEGKQAQGVTGPLTFGEVAYQLLNQTMAYLTVSEVGSTGHSGTGSTGHSGAGDLYRP